MERDKQERTRRLALHLFRLETRRVATSFTARYSYRTPFLFPNISPIDHIHLIPPSVYPEADPPARKLPARTYFQPELSYDNTNDATNMPHYHYANNAVDAQPYLSMLAITHCVAISSHLQCYRIDNEAIG